MTNYAAHLTTCCAYLALERADASGAVTREKVLQQFFKHNHTLVRLALKFHHSMKLLKRLEIVLVRRCMQKIRLKPWFFRQMKLYTQVFAAVFLQK
jgi:hypothetical protein